MNKKNVSELTLEEIKALKCDHYENIEMSRQSLMALNTELQRRDKEKQQPINGEAKEISQ